VREVILPTVSKPWAIVCGAPVTVNELVAGSLNQPLGWTPLAVSVCRPGVSCKLAVQFPVASCQPGCVAAGPGTPSTSNFTDAAPNEAPDVGTVRVPVLSVNWVTRASVLTVVALTYQLVAPPALTSALVRMPSLFVLNVSRAWRSFPGRERRFP